MSLSLEGLHAGYGRVPIIHDVSLDLESGQCFALLGKNGMGKTTLLRAVLGIAARYSGDVVVCGQPVSDWPTHRIIRLGVSYVPQDENIFEDLTVEENLRLGALRATKYGAARGEVMRLFPLLGDRTRQKAGTLSGGEQKMLIIGRALMPRPRLVILDEVSEGLQPSIRTMVTEALRAYREETGSAVLLVEQNLDFALGSADTFAVLNGGRIVEEGQVSDELAVNQIERHMTL